MSCRGTALTCRAAGGLDAGSPSGRVGTAWGEPAVGSGAGGWSKFPNGSGGGQRISSNSPRSMSPGRALAEVKQKLSSFVAGRGGSLAAGEARAPGTGQGELRAARCAVGLVWRLARAVCRCCAHSEALALSHLPLLPCTLHSTPTSLHPNRVHPQTARDRVAGPRPFMLG